MTIYFNFELANTFTRGRFSQMNDEIEITVGELSRRLGVALPRCAPGLGGMALDHQVMRLAPTAGMTA